MDELKIVRSTEKYAVSYCETFDEVAKAEGNVPQWFRDGVAAALLSSYLDRPIDAHTVVCGEIGLAGEVRAVGQMEQRLKEARRLGFTRFLLPASTWRRLAERGEAAGEMALAPVANVAELARTLFGA